MKYSIYDLQVLDALLNSLKHLNGYKDHNLDFKLLVKYQNEFITCDFFKCYNVMSPEYLTYNSFKIETINAESCNQTIEIALYKLMQNSSFSNCAKELNNNPELLLTKLLLILDKSKQAFDTSEVKEITNTSNKILLKNFIYNVKFFNSEKVLKFIQIDDEETFEIISLVSEK